jgi:ion channel-forming bestrophin family protein
VIDYNPRRWTQSLLAVNGSVTPKIIWRVAWVAVWSAAVMIFHTFVYRVAVPPTAHTLVGLAVGLLLVFRTNGSYERFWEGRKMWGNIVNDSRNVARTTAAFLDRRSELLEPIVLWTASFSYACMHSLRGAASIGPLARRLAAAEVAQVEAAQHVPSAVAFRISRLVAAARAAGHLSDYVSMEIEGGMRRLIDHLGACERIRKTPVPFAYVVHLRTAMVVFGVTLPFALLDSFGWSSIIYNSLIAFVLFGIEEIGVEIENPFGVDANDLPLEQICSTIEQDLLAVVEQSLTTTTK